MLLKINAGGTSPFKVQDQPKDFNSSKYRKFTDAASDAALQLTSKKPALFQCRCGSKEKYP